MSSFAKRPKPNLGNFADQLHIDPALAASLQPKTELKLPDFSAAPRNGLSPDMSGLFNHFTEDKSFNDRLDPFFNDKGIGIPGTQGRGRLMPITPWNKPDRPQPKTPGQDPD
jgi:hypothetical protein